MALSGQRVLTGGDKALKGASKQIDSKPQLRSRLVIYFAFNIIFYSPEITFPVKS
jgi:hypothetical protein